MPKSIRFSSLALFALVSLGPAVHAQTPTHPPSFTPIPPIAFDSSGPVIRAHTEALKPFTVAGERGVLLGQQDGAFEAWVLPVKVLSHLNLSAEVEGYTVPIDVNQQSAVIEVHPDRTIITYAHIAFTVRQIMFSPNDAPPGTGPVVLFEFDCLHPTDFTFRFTPNLEFMWPMRNEGIPGVEWVAPHAALQAGDSRGENDKSSLATSGYYVLHSDYPDLAAALTIPGATAGILAPYQERPQVHPVELKLHIDSARDRGHLYPLLMAVGTNPSTANTQALGATLENLNQNLASLYQAHAEAYKKLLANSVSIDTPDKSLNEAFQWAVVSIEQLKAKPWSPDPVKGINVKGTGFSPYTNTQRENGALAPEGNPSSTTTVASGHDVSRPENSQPEGHEASGHDLSRAKKDVKENGALAPASETALVAGYFASGDSARPGFGWFFGRDSLYTLYAVNGFGDFALAKSELEFLIHRQRDDGKIMHEYSQTAAAIHWLQFPYMYAAADSTPLFLLATLDYVRASGDTAFLAANREAIEKAWGFETSHAPDGAHGGNGIYTNEQGTGWVESWPGGMPHQEIYLALLDQQASAAMGQIEDLLHDQEKARNARRRAEDIATTINAQFYDQDKGCYAFSRNKDGSLDHTTTVYPALAWWSSSSVIDPGPISDGLKPHIAPNSILQHPEGCLQQLASHTLNTDWGLRDVSSDEKIYDGMSYHQGSVWPLFTGWAALAEYRGNQPLAGYQMLMENVNLTKAQDLGAVTELLSGDYNVPFGRSTSHQLWSSAMVITPVLRGLFGIDIDATTKTITVNPHLPMEWKGTATVKGLRTPDGFFSLTFDPEDFGLRVIYRAEGMQGWKLLSGVSGSHVSGYDTRELVLPVDSVDVQSLSDTGSIGPLPGSRTSDARVIREERGKNSVTLAIEGRAGSDATLLVTEKTAKTFGKIKLKVSDGLSDHAKPGESGATLNSLYMGDGVLKPPYSSMLAVHFPPGEGWKTITVTLTW